MTTLAPSSQWTLPQIENFFDDCVIPISLGCIAANGIPMNCSLWFLYAGGEFWCATQQTSKIVGYLRENPRCGFEIASQTIPYRGVRGQGKTEICETNGAEILGQLIDRYLEARNSRLARWLLKRSDSEVAIRIQPLWMTSWDFSGRMN